MTRFQASVGVFVEYPYYIEVYPVNVHLLPFDTP